jgi:hypothetical protein
VKRLLLVGFGFVLLAGVLAATPPGQRALDRAEDAVEHATTSPDRAPAAGSRTCARSNAPGPAQKAAPKLPRFAHVVVIVMENKECDRVIGDSDAPYMNALARKYAFASGFYGVRHPSLPNYLALIGGSTFGISSDCTSCHVDQPNLVDQLEAAGISWKAYMEGYPSGCFTGASDGRYAKKHNPFMYFDDITGNAGRCAKVVPLTQLNADLKARKLPKFAFISPDLCNDTHDCGVKDGDRFLAGLVPKLLPALGKNGIVVITYDEGKSDTGCCGVAVGGHIATIIAGPGARRTVSVRGPFTHYSVLATIEKAWRLPRLGNARSARDLRGLIRLG